MKWSDRSVQEMKIIYNIITCNPEPQGMGKSDSFPQTGSFGKAWTGSVKAPKNYMKTWMFYMSKAYKVNKLVFISSPFYIDKEKQ